MRTMTKARTKGSALILALVAFLFMAGIGGAIFSLSLSGRRTTMAASFGDQAYHLAEAGIDDAINRMRGLTNGVSGTDYDALTAASTDWDGVAANVFRAELHGGGAYAVSISPPFVPNTYGSYTIKAVGTIANETRGLTTYVASEKGKPPVEAGLFGDVYLDTGGTIKTDGYFSNKGSYASQVTGTVNGTAVANMTGHVGSNGDVDVSGNSMVYGNATPGPNGQVTGGGKIYGSTAPASEAVALNLPDMTPPTNPAPTTIANVNGSYTFTGGTYHVTGSISPSGQSSVKITGNTVIYVDGDFVFTGQPKLEIASGATLTIYQNSKDGSAKFNIAGGSVVNNSQLPTSLMLYSNTKTGKLTGNANFYGMVYAPDTAMSILGTSDLFGATVAKSIDIQGTPFFHYDQSLENAFPPVYKVNAKAVESFTPPTINVLTSILK